MKTILKTPNIFRSQRLIISMTSVFFLYSNIAYGQTANLNELMKERVQSAEQIISDISKLEASQKQLHAQTELRIAQATRLKGEARILENKIPSKPLNAKLIEEQLQEAQQKYKADIKEFAAHAAAYNQHLQQFQATIGECHANNKALATVIDRYQIHVQQFHLPMTSIKPPHICGRMAGQVGDLSHVANQMMYDQLRLMQTEGELLNEQSALRASQATSASLKDKATSAALRAQNEEQLVADFGRLHEEYTLLKSEKDYLDGAIKLTQTSVSGKITPRTHGG